MAKTVGVLALQGAFAKHIAVLKQLNINALEVKTPQDLQQCDGLIIPGGESTTILRQLKFIELEEPLREFGKSRPLFGTCAGLILMSKKILNDQMQPYGFLDVVVERNAYGRQADSFQTELEVKLHPKKLAVTPAFFIRAPRIRQIGEEVQVLSSYEQEPVLVQQGKYLGASFHPELTHSDLIHRHFLTML